MPDVARSGARACIVALTIAVAPLAARGAPKEAPVVKIGVIADVSGRAAAFGISQRNAYALAADEVRAGRIDAGRASLALDVRDAASDAAQAARAAQTFAGDGAALLLGPTLSREAARAVPLAVRANLTVLATSNTAHATTALGPCVFRNALGEDRIVPQAVDRIVDARHPKTAAIVYGADNAFTADEYVSFKAALERRHVTLVDVQAYRAGDVDFGAKLAHVARAKPDLLVVAALLDEGAKIVVRARDAHLAAAILGGGGLDSPKFPLLAGDAAEGVTLGVAYVPFNSYAGNREFVERYKARFGTAPDRFSAQAYAAVQIAAAAIRGGATTSPALCAAFKRASAFATVLGPVDFLPSGDVRGAAALVRVTNGAFAYAP